MKRFLLSFLLTVICSLRLFAQDGLELFSKKSDVIPTFIYGHTEFDSLLKSDLVVPMQALYELESDIRVSFIIDTIGNIDSITTPFYKVIRKSTKKVLADSVFVLFKKGCVDEVIRVISLTNGLWTPSKINGKPCAQRVFYDLHIDLFKYAAFYKLSDADEKQGGFPFQIMLGFDNQKHKLLYNMGVRKLASNKVVLAKVYFEEALKYNHQDQDALYNLGICYFKMNDKKHACTCWKAGSKLGDAEATKLLTKYCTN